MFEYELINILLVHKCSFIILLTSAISDNNDTHYVFMYQVDQIRQIVCSFSKIINIPIPVLKNCTNFHIL